MTEAVPQPLRPGKGANHPPGMDSEPKWLPGPERGTKPEPDTSRNFYRVINVLGKGSFGARSGVVDFMRRICVPRQTYTICFR